jgi:hypothetical protein
MDQLKRSIRRLFAASLRPLALASIGVILITASHAFGQQKRRSAGRKPAANARFDHGDRIVIPADFGDNTIVLRVTVNNAAPLKFFFDTGAGMSLLDSRRAAALHLKKTDDVKATGIGGSIQGSFVNGVSLRVAGVTVHNQPLALLPLDFPCEAQDVAGIIGYDFIKEFVVEIDYEAKTVSLFNPALYKYNGRGDLIPLVISHNTPRIHARIGLPGRTSVEALFEIDTGSDGALSINSPFVKKHALLQLLTTQFDSTHLGLGGASKSVDVRIGELQMGRQVIASPLVSLSRDIEGSLASEDNDGPLGNEILRRFKIVLDYSRQRMIVEPNSHLSDPIEAGMSGIDFDTEDCRPFKVIKVADNSPAAEAGIKAGDEIVAIDGRPFKEIPSFEMEKLLSRDGAQYALTLNRAGTTLVVKIKLRRLL